MTTFILAAGTLALAAGLAIAWPLLRAPEVSRRRAAGWIAVAVVPGIAALVYALTGDPGALSAAPAAPKREAPHALAGSQMAAMADRVAARLRDKPDDAEGWAMLGRSLAAAGRFAEAANAFGEASRRLPGNAAVLAEWADVLAMAQGRQFGGQPDRLVEAALSADPRNVRALALAGTSAFERGDFAVAAKYWRRLLAEVPARSEMARQVEASARDAERRAETATAAVVTGTVAFAPGHAATLGPAAVIYVVARPRDGRGRPVAVAKLKPAALPAAFRLDDGNSLLEGSPLSGHSEIVLEARLARDGAAQPRAGDPRSVPRASRPGERGIRLELRPAAP